MEVWKGRVQFVRKVVDHFVDLLTPQTTEPDFNLLSDFFSIEQTEGPQKKRQLGSDKDDRPKVDYQPVDPKWYHIRERAGGFTVGRTPNVPMPARSIARSSDVRWPAVDSIGRLQHPTFELQVSLLDQLLE